ncbi:MAG: ABC transporter permease, partial [Chloroflexota bacterium]|nr:ABC transporter permease [Chloroflexota bacterium]
MLIVPEASFAAIVNDPATPRLYAAAWYAALEVTAVRGGDVPGLIDRIGHATAELDRVLPGITLSRSPVEALARHRDQVRLLTVTLALFSVPLLGLIGYFIVQAAGMVVQRQQQEIAVLRSRGSSRPQVLALALGEGLALGAAALLAGVPLSLLAAQLIAWTQSFLHFVPLPGPRVELLTASWLHGALVVACVLPAILIPALKASGRTIISYKQERARSVRAPLWQRLFLDILLLVPALYGYQQLRLHGMLGVPGVAAAADDPFRNPVMVLAPALLVFALALLALRLVPQMLKLLAWLLSRAPGVALLALRFLGRATQAYSTPVLLITLTLSLATFTASMARTLDQHSYARARYGGGADVRLGPAPASPPSGTTGDPSAGATSTDTSSLDYLFVPVDDFLQTEGVEAVTRVAPSDVFVAPGGGVQEEGTFLGIDRETLPAVLAESWRADYAPESLGALMNRLAQDPAAALVAAGYAAERGLRTGDRITVRMNNLGTTREVPFVIAGMVRFFPTLYSESGPFVIGNLDYSAEAQGGQYPYEIWMDLAPNARLTAIEAVALGYGLRILNDTPQALLEADLLRPERQGLFGLLSVGFLAATLVTILGFLAYTLVSFQRRLVELGMLRAIGLGAGQLASLLIYEQALVIGVGTSVGTLLGVLGSRLFVPFLQVRVGEFPDTPPFVVQIAWDQIALVYGVAAGLLLLTVGATLLLLRRMRIFEAVKLGEAV